MKIIEVELRGHLNDESHKALLNYLEKNGELTSIENRFLLDYSTFKEGIGERKLDVRVRITNGKPEIVAKKGKFGGIAREEASVFLDHSDLKRALHLMALLGYTKAVACDRGIVRYECDGIEIAIQDIRYFPDTRAGNKLYGRFFEVEILSEETGRIEAENKLISWVADRNLEVFSEDAWNNFVKIINNEANGVYDFHETSYSDIADCGLDANKPS